MKTSLATHNSLLVGYLIELFYRIHTFFIVPGYLMAMLAKDFIVSKAICWDRNGFSVILPSKYWIPTVYGGVVGFSSIIKDTPLESYND